MTSWRILDASQYSGTLHYRRGRVTAGQNSTALNDLAALIIGQDCTIAPGLFAALARFDVLMVHVDWRGKPQAATTAWTGHSRVAARQRAQAQLSQPRSKNAWKRIVKAKLRGQAATLADLDHPVAGELLSLARRVRSGDPDNLEARAARTYWNALRSESTFSRAPRKPDTINQALDYGYAIVRTRMIRAITGAGLSPTLGLWHRTRDNPFVLADDLMEPFRPAVDHIVFSIGEIDELDTGLKHQLVGVLQAPMTAGGSSIAAAMDTLAAQYGQYVEGQLDRLPVPVWKAR